MSPTADAPPDRKEAFADRVWAQWRWLVAAVILVFVLNNFLGVIAGAAGALAFAGRISGRLLKARRMVEEVQRLVADPDDSGRGVGE